MTFHGRPRFRPAIQAVPALSQDGEEIVVFVDPEALSEGRVAVSRAAGVLVHALLDGTRDRETFLHDWREVTGTEMPEGKLEGLLRALDEAVLLEGPRVARARRAALDAYRNLPRRPAVHAGTSYAPDADALAAEVTAWRKDADVDPVPGPVRAVLAPHIDPRGGGACHGAAAAAYAASPADVYVILGTAHAGLQRPFSLTTQDFDTPAGPVTTDVDLVHRLAGRSGGGLLDEERAHLGEHSVEFQATWLKVVHAERPDLRIVPVLVGSQHGRILEGSSPREDPEVVDFVNALREMSDEYGDRLCLVASVDLAHVGPNYDQPEAPDAAELERVLDADRELLASARDLDPDGWFRLLHEVQDENNVCGAAPTWTLLAALEGAELEGHVLRHDAWEIDAANGSHVTFAALSWNPRGEDA